MAVSAAAACEAATLTVKVENVSSEGGTLRVGVWDSATFTQKKPLHGISQSAKAGEMVVAFTNLAPGEYAVKVLQDVNSNGKPDKNLLGFPTEPFGFSNAPAFITHAPSFDDAKFAVHDGDNTIAIRLR